MSEGSWRRTRLENKVTPPAALIELIERPLMLRLRGAGKEIAEHTLKAAPQETSQRSATEFRNAGPGSSPACAAAIDDLIIPRSLLKPPCDKCGELFEPSQLATVRSWFSLGVGAGFSRNENLCRACRDKREDEQ